MPAKVTEDHLVRANRLIGCGLDQEQVSQWLAEHEKDKTEVERLRDDIGWFLHLVSCDPDGTIDWTRLRSLLESYATQFGRGQDALAEVERLQAIVAKLPKTAREE